MPMPIRTAMSMARHHRLRWTRAARLCDQYLRGNLGNQIASDGANFFFGRVTSDLAKYRV